MGKRRLGRELALQALYLVDVAHLPLEEALGTLLRGNGNVDSESKKFAENLAQGTLSELKVIDDCIKSHAKNWDIPRMAAVDRNLLRLSTFELLENVETPVNVIINESIEIAKKYSSEDSGKFINGILDKIKQHRKVKT